MPRLTALLLAWTSLSCLSGPAPGQDPPPKPADALRSREAPTKTGPACIDLRRVERSEILDNRTIHLFNVPGPDLTMHLRRDCPELRYHDTFYFNTQEGEICAGFDWITTRAGYACLIDRFEKVPLPKAPRKPPPKSAPEEGKTGPAGRR